MYMDIRIKTTDYQMVGDVSDYLNERIDAIARHMGDGSDQARAEVNVGRSVGGSKHGEVWFAEINIIHSGHASIHAHATAASVNAAIDQAKDEILNQLRKSKQVHRRVLRKGGAALKGFLRFGGGE